MRLRELITSPPEVCGLLATLQRAASDMTTSGIGSLGVMSDGLLVGIITERDITEAVGRGVDTATEPVRCCMTSHPDVLSGDTDVLQAAEWMLETGYRHLPVVDEEFLGILSIRDVLVAIVDPGRILH